MSRRYQDLNCGNCEFALTREIDQLAAHRARAAGVAVPHLHCRLYALPVAKQSDDFCGQHSEAQLLRNLDLADQVAIAVVRQLQEPTAREAVIDRMRPKHREGS